MSGETKLLTSQDFEGSGIHDLTVIETKICLLTVNGGIEPDVIAKSLGISKTKINQILKKPEIEKFINHLKKKLTVNAVQNTTNQLKALQDKAFVTLIERFDEPDHTRDLPPDALPEQIKLYYQGYARYTPMDKVAKIYETVSKMAIENSPDSARNEAEDKDFESRVRGRFEERRTKTKKMIEIAQKKGIDPSALADIMGDDLYDIDGEGRVTKAENKQPQQTHIIEETEVIERTVTIEGSSDDINSLSAFNPKR